MCEAFSIRTLLILWWIVSIYERVSYRYGMDLKTRFDEDRGAFIFGILRVLLGAMLFWAFLDKMFGLGYATPAGSGFIDGGSPTKGFLIGASNGTFGWLFEPMVDISGILDVVILLAMFALGVGLILGIGKKLCCIGGMAMFFVFYLAMFPLSNNPILDEHVIYIVVLLGVLLTKSCESIGFGRRWKETALVKRFPILE